MRLTWTAAGYAALVNPDNTGTNAVLCAQIAVGRGTTPASRADTALEDEIKRLDTISGQAVDNDIIHVVLRDETNDIYGFTEFGLIADDGTLLARYAQPETIIEKAAGSTALLPIDAMLTDVDATQIVFPSAEFVNPPWGENTQGVLARATQALAEAGEDNLRGMSPLRTFQAIAAWLDAEHPGAGGGINADRLDDYELADIIKRMVETHGSTSQDPNTATDPLILTKHANTPSPNSSYWFIRTIIHYNNRQYRYQVATQYNLGSARFYRGLEDGVWGAWVRQIDSKQLQQSATDATAGALMTVGAFGLGGYAPVLDDLDKTTTPSGMYRVRQGQTTGEVPDGFSNGYVAIITDSGDVTIETLYSGSASFDNADARVFVRRYYSSGNRWTPWREIYHEGRNDVVGQLQHANALTSQHDLNDLPDGWYCWGGNSTKPANAPNEYSMLVQQSDTNQKIQFVVGRYGYVYSRRADDGTFNPWERLLKANEAATKADAIAGTKTDVYMPPLRVHEAFGAFGLGASALPEAPNLNVRLPTGFYTVRLDATGQPNGWPGGSLYVATRDADISTQILISLDNQFWYRAIYKGVFLPWRKMWHDGNHGPDSGLAAETAARADDAADSERLDGKGPSYYLALANAMGPLPRANASGTYDIDVTGNADTATRASQADNADALGGIEAAAYRLKADHILPTNTHAFADQISAYPVGVSVMYVRSADGWPSQAGTVVTVRPDEASAGYQEYINGLGDSGETTRYRWTRIYHASVQAWGSLDRVITASDYATDDTPGVVTRATDQTAASGVNNTHYVTPKHLRAAMPVYKRTAQLEFADATIKRLWHYMGRPADNAWATLVCVNAVDGYAVGDVVFNWRIYDNASTGGNISVSSDASSIALPLGDHSVYVIRKQASAAADWVGINRERDWRIVLHGVWYS